MSGNSIGKILKLISFGESHGIGIGGVLEGVPAGLPIKIEIIQHDLDRRRPGQSSITTSRREEDKVEILSGLIDGVTTGTPIGFLVYNKDQRSKDYDDLKNIYRPSHADFTYEKKYGIRDYRGGGRSSARETVARVVAGSIAKMILNKFSIKIYTYVSQVHRLKLETHYSQLDFSMIEESVIRCPDKKISELFIKSIHEAREKGDSLGGVITCVIKNIPVGLGEPVFDKLHADLGKAMLSINAVKGFEYGEGFNSVNFTGTEFNDEFFSDAGVIKTKTNKSGGIQGGISNGEDIYFRVAFKPTATVRSRQETVNNSGQKVEIESMGRHDPCVLPRAVPIVESMAALVMADHLLRSRLNKI